MSSGLIGGLLMQWPLGKTSDLFDRRTVFILLTFLLAVVALAMVPLVKTGFNALIVGIVIYGGINFALYPLALAHTNDYLSAEQVVPAAAGMILAYSWGLYRPGRSRWRRWGRKGSSRTIARSLRAVARNSAAGGRRHGRGVSVLRMSMLAALDPRAAAPDAGARGPANRTAGDAA